MIVIKNTSSYIWKSSYDQFFIESVFDPHSKVMAVCVLPGLFLFVRAGLGGDLPLWWRWHRWYGHWHRLIACCYCWNMKNRLQADQIIQNKIRSEQKLSVKYLSDVNRTKMMDQSWALTEVSNSDEGIILLFDGFNKKLDEWIKVLSEHCQRFSILL